MIFHSLFLPGAFLVEPEKRTDNRGFLARLYCEREFSDHGLDVKWVQINNSLNLQKGTLRGLHFQEPPKSEVKMVRCIRGSIWDVIVDMRKASATFGKWFGTELCEENRKMMYVPHGFAHGFVSFTDNSEIVYLSSEHYSPECERILRWDDPLHQIKWPIKPIIISEKDKSAASMTELDAVQF